MTDYETVRRIVNEEIARHLRPPMLIELKPGTQIDPRTVTHVASHGKLCVAYQTGGERIKVECESEVAAKKLADDFAAKVNAACGTQTQAFTKPVAETR